MAAQTKHILFFKDIDKGDLPKVGGKGANLGEMTKVGFPVPDGFAVTVASYDLFLDDNVLTAKIPEIIKSLDVHDPAQLSQVSSKVQRLIKQGKIPSTVKKEVYNAYKKLSGHLGHALVAVRSSATAEDLPQASFAGQQDTYLNIKGEANLLNAVRECWASLFTPRAIFYRAENEIRTDQVKISVIIQKMIQSEVSGVMFTVDPVTNEKDRIIIEAVWGLGELIVQGAVTPDRYVVQKETFDILSKQVSDQDVLLSKKGNTTIERKVTKKLIGIQKICDDEIVKLAKIGQGLQDHYYFPQDIEWSKEKEKLYIVQTRPVTTMKNKRIGSDNVDDSSLPILKGTPASPGMAKGRVIIIKNPKEIGRVEKGDVLVSVMTSPDFVPAMKKASAIITDQGGMTSHAAIVSRELGIPCVVGTKTATKTLKEGDNVTVNGESGNIFKGLSVKMIETKKQVLKKDLNTATKLYVNLAEPERASEIAKKNVDGVGLLRAEFMIANIGIHPKEAIKQRKQHVYIEKIVQGITTFCKEFNPRPVIIRATDFKTNEYRSLEGGKKWEPVESNPMLGYRGAFRYISSPEVFSLELKAIKRVRDKYKNLWLMVPFVRSPKELSEVRKIVASEGLFNDTSFKFLMMVEIPVNVILLDKFIEVGIDGVSIGSNDLTMLISGTDRDNAEVSGAFDERSDAVLWAIKKTIKTCNKYNITSSICGQAPSVYDEYVEKLVSFGVTSISVNPDAIDRVRNSIYEAEKRR